MNFNSEAELQSYCLEILRARNIDATEEVAVGGLRADIVTKDTVYEIKKVLTREALYQALGQAITYNQYLKRKHICIVGQAPTNTVEYEQALKIARAISSEGVIVSFIESDPFWSNAVLPQSKYFAWLKNALHELCWMVGLGMGFALLFLLVFQLAPHRSQSPPTPFDRSR